MNPSDHRTMRFHYAAALLACAFAVVTGASCDADLETSCVDGTCTGASTATGAGGSGPCAGDDHGLPCGVYDILSSVCQQCHIPGGQGPFPLQEYCDTQQEYGKKPIWVRMQAAIKPDAFPRMPFMQDPLPDDQMATLNAWFETCGSNVEPYDFNQCVGAQNGPPPTCGEGGAGGGGGAPAGGAGGAGGAPAGGAGGAGGI